MLGYPNWQGSQLFGRCAMHLSGHASSNMALESSTASLSGTCVEHRVIEVLHVTMPDLAACQDRTGEAKMLPGADLF